MSPSLKVHDLPPLPRLAKKRTETRARQTKTADVGLEDFIDWTSVVASEPTEEEEMSNLATEFAAWMRKRTIGSKGEATSISGGKRSRQFPPDDRAQKDWAIVSVDSLDRASNDQPTLADCLNEAGASLE